MTDRHPIEGETWRVRADIPRGACLRVEVAIGLDGAVGQTMLYVEPGTVLYCTGARTGPYGPFVTWRLTAERRERAYKALAPLNKGRAMTVYPDAELIAIGHDLLDLIEPDVP